tara:strand:+ start:1613 stop:2605 length:993 start_codon:yes stop_codon:yes gene_type:complete
MAYRYRPYTSGYISGGGFGGRRGGIGRYRRSGLSRTLSTVGGIAAAGLTAYALFKGAKAISKWIKTKKADRSRAEDYLSKFPGIENNRLNRKIAIARLDNDQEANLELSAKAASRSQRNKERKAKWDAFKDDFKNLAQEIVNTPGNILNIPADLRKKKAAKEEANYQKWMDEKNEQARINAELESGDIIEEPEVDDPEPEVDAWRKKKGIGPEGAFSSTKEWVDAWNVAKEAKWQKKQSELEQHSDPSIRLKKITGDPSMNISLDKSQIKLNKKIQSRQNLKDVEKFNLGISTKLSRGEITKTQADSLYKPYPSSGIDWGVSTEEFLNPK